MQAPTRTGVKIRKTIICPNCWREFPPQRARFISESPRLLGDPIAGPAEQMRFRAMRFDAAGNAIDPDEARCNRMACPSCHLEFPRAMVELPECPISVIGAPQSGKTNLLASGLWNLAQRSHAYGLEFVDADPRFNEVLHRNENLLFASATSDMDVTLPKTDVGGADLYRYVSIDGNSEMMPKPMYFLVRHDGTERRSVTVLYDNAGEHFLTNPSEALAESSTRHLERSRALLMVFDPIQDLRFREALASGIDAPRASGHQRQELVFNEAIARVRRLRGLDPVGPIEIPVIVALTKADVWADKAFGPTWDRLDLPTDLTARRRAITECIKAIDARARAALSLRAPEFVNTVAALAKHAFFVPASALGTSPERNASGAFQLRAERIRPRWAEMPFVAALAATDRHLFPDLRK